PRLGIRSLGGWRSTDLPDIVGSAHQRCIGISRMIAQLGTSTAVVCSIPTLPLPPLFITRTDVSGVNELDLHHFVTELAWSISLERAVRIINTQTLDEISPTAYRFDAKSQATAGFPYRLEHASRLATLLAKSIYQPAPKKGLITDLDETMWAGVL